MSEENVEIVRFVFDAFERGQLDEMFELVTNDLTTHRVEPDNAIYHGKEGFLQATADWIEGFEEWTVTPEEFIDGKDSVLVRVRQTARGEKSGVPVESNIWFVFEMRGRKIVRLEFPPERSRSPRSRRAVGVRGSARGAGRWRMTPQDGPGRTRTCDRRIMSPLL